MLANHCVRGRRIGENINAVYYFNNIDLCSNVSNMHACDVVTIEIKTSSRLPQNEFVQFDSSGIDSILVISDVNAVVDFFFLLET